ncbi:MAG TPA: hypothetical protein VFU76_17050 [Terriglobales bacterium]|nr:hypothetical protein [Terriglobales bacterium]
MIVPAGLSAQAPSTPVNIPAQLPRVHGVAKESVRSAANALQTMYHFDYYGGPVISNVDVVVVFWGPHVSSVVTGGIAAFYASLTDSRYLDMLSEYGTKGLAPTNGAPPGDQIIGHGSLNSEHTITPGNTSKALTDSDVQIELLAQINAGKLPAPTFDSHGKVNTWYVIYFPPGITISLGGQTSCAPAGFCAYHGSVLDRDSKLLSYGVVPDFGAGSGCDVGCGAGTEFDNVTSTSAHELAESVTDASVNLPGGSLLGWYDLTDNVEIGDICSSRSVLNAGYTVQDVWSNLQGGCVSRPPSLLVSPPATAAAGSPVAVPVTIKTTAGTVLSNYRGTVHFTSSDSTASLPANYTFTSADAGTHTFRVTFNSAGAQSVAVADTVAIGFTGHASVTVNSASATRLVITAPSTIAAGAPFNFTVAAKDGGNNTVASYSGTVHFSSTDPAASLPADAKLSNGTGTFSAILRTAGGQTLTATDTATASIQGSAAVTVSLANLTIAVSHSGNFRQGQTGAAYSIIVANAGGAPTSGPVSVSEAIPSGLTLAGLSGDGWTCVATSASCTRSDALAASSSYPPISVTVNVAPNAPAQLTNTATVSGGGEQNTSDDSAGDVTTIVPAADLTISLTRSGSFAPGAAGSSLTATVGNVGPGPTAGTVTVAIAPAAGLAATSVIGTGWTCSGSTCTRSDVLAPGGSYPPITMAVSVNAAPTAASTATVSGGGEVNLANDTASDNGTLMSPVTVSTTTPNVTVTGGQAVQVPLTVTVNAGVTVALSCSGLPASASCSFNPGSAGAGVSNVVMTIDTAATSAKSRRRAPAVWAMLMMPAFGFVLLPGAGVRRRRLLLALALAAVLSLPGCGGNVASSTPTQPGTSVASAATYNVVVTAQGGGFQGQTTLALTIR